MTQIQIKHIAIVALAPALALASPAQGAAPAHYVPAAENPYAAAQELGSTVEHHRKRYRHRHYYDDDGYGRYSDGYRRYDQPVYRDTRVWRGRDGRYYCRKEDGTTGLLIGAAVGGLIGNELAGRGDKTLGAILGAAGGAILGRSIDRSNARCR